MNFLFALIPEMPLLDLVISVVGIIGAVLITYAIFLEAERRQDAVLLLGGICLLVYALFIGNTIFSVAMGGLVIASLFELVEIMIGIHKHGPKMLEKYKYPKGEK
jgi:C4-dicarboxylate transporter